MKFQMVHQNFNVSDLEKSMAFYEAAFGLKEVSRITPKDGAFQIVYVGNETTDFVLELTWPLPRMTYRQPTQSMKRWDASAWKIRRWEFIL